MVTRDMPIGFAGLGNLGQAMCLNLLEKGWTLNVLDRSERRMAPLLAAGARVASAAQLADAEVICFAVPDEVAIYEILDDGLSEHLGPQHTVIVHSTILPARARELADHVLEHTGAHYLDAPVSGGAERARAGDLTLLVGGEPDNVGRVRHVLEELARELFLLGPVGAGAATKLANQLIMFASLAGVHEALRLTRSAGVDDDAVLKAVATGTGDTWVGRNWGFFDDVAADYNGAGVPVSDRPWSKDLSEVVSAARDYGLALPLAGLLAQITAPLIENNPTRRNDRKVDGQ